jgi:hypothetical protein
MSIAIAMGIPECPCLLWEASYWVLEKISNRGYSLLGRVVDKADTLADVALETLSGLGQQSLLLLGNTLEGVGSLLSTVGLCNVSILYASRNEE